MTINIQYERLPFSEAMTEYIINKMNKLGERYQWITKAQVFFRRQEDAFENRETCEIKLSFPGSGIFASANDVNFEVAAKETTRQIEKHLQSRIRILRAHNVLSD